MFQIAFQHKKSILFAITILLCHVISATNIVYITDKNIYKLNNESYIYSDSTKLHTINTITSELLQNHFLLNKKDFIRIDFSNSNYWIKTELYNSNRHPVNLILAIESSSINKLQLFIVKNGKKEYRVETGDKWPFQSREFDNPFFMYDVSLDKMEHAILFLKIQNEGDAHNFNYNLYAHKYLTEKNEKNSFIHGIFYGMLFFVILLTSITLYLFKSKNARINFYFLLVVLLFSLWNANLDGITFQYLWPYSSWLTNYASYSLPLMSTLFLQLFVAEFNNIKKSPTLYKLHIALFLIVASVIISTAFNSIPIYFKYILSISSGILSLVFMIIITLKHKNTKTANTNFFLFVFFLFIAWLVLVIMLLFFGKINTSVAEVFLKVFLLLQILLLLASITSKIKGFFISNQKQEIDKLQKEIGIQSQEVVDTKEELQYVKEKLRNNRVINEDLRKQIEKQMILSETIFQSIMQEESSFSSFLFESSILFIPKEQIGGDIYWIEKIKENTIIACIDCSGHGAKGATFAIGVHQKLHRIILIDKLTNPKEILNKLQDALLNETNSKIDYSYNVKISIVSLNSTKREITYAGAQQPIFIIRDNKIRQVKSKNKRIRLDNNNDKEDFISYTFNLMHGDCIYLSTDGYYNQINGGTMKKFKKNNFKELLQKIHKLPLQKQRSRLDASFNNWSRGYEQIDDVLIIALRIL